MSKYYKVELYFNTEITDDYSYVDDFVRKNNLFKVSNIDYLTSVDDFDEVLEAYKDNKYVSSPEFDDHINSNCNINEVAMTIKLSKIDEELYKIKNILNKTENKRNKMSAYCYIKLDDKDNLIIKSRTIDKNSVGVNQQHPKKDQIIVLTAREFNNHSIDEIKERMRNFLTLSAEEYNKYYRWY